MRRILAAVLALLAATAPAAEEGEKPKQLGLSERVQRHLAQIDVSLTGPPERLLGLRPDQFSLWVNGMRVKPVALDALCPAGAAAAASPTTSTEPESPVAAPTSYLFFFDQRNMTFEGRRHAVEQAKELVSRLVQRGNRGSVISSGKKVTTFANFTDRADVLIDALDRLFADVGQWDDYPALEGSRQDNVVMALRGGPEPGCQQARMYQREERSRAEHALELFQLTLGRFAELDAPKVALYFADTLREQPGRHYLSIAGDDCISKSSDTRLSFLKLHEAAGTYGVTVYAVQAEGLVSPAVSGARGARDAALKDGQAGLKTIALETGGNAFLNGAGTDSVVERIEAAGACLYVLSIDATPFPQDKPLPVRVDVDVPGVKTRARTTLVIQSESARRMATLLAAFTAPDTLHDTVPMHGALVPLDLDGEKLRLLVQASLPETILAQGEEWDVGMSLVSGPAVRDEASGRISVKRPGVCIVLESEMSVRPGPFEVALVGMESTTGRVATGRLSGSWIGALSDGVSATSILQPAEGAFLRDGKVRTTGSLAIGDQDAVRADRPVAFVTLVCRTQKRQTTARVLRSLSGPTSSEFDPLDLPLGESGCAQVRDVVPPGTLASGDFSYGIKVEGAERGQARGFHVD